jgi:hypothetical protein
MDGNAYDYSMHINDNSGLMDETVGGSEEKADDDIVI